MPWQLEFRGRLPGESDLVVQVLRQLSSTDRDDVSEQLLGGASDTQITGWAADPAGRRALTMMVGELSSGVTSGGERAIQDRVMRLLTRHEEPHDGGPAAAGGPPAGSPNADTPAALIARHTNWGGLNLREESLGTDLVGRLPGQAAFVEQVLDRLPSRDRDDVAVAMMDVLTDGSAIRRSGRCGPGGPFSSASCASYMRAAQARMRTAGLKRLMRLITEADGAGRSASQRMEVEVITFLYGGRALDTIGTAVGARGHAAIIVGDLAYSFEAGWSCGRTRAQYLHANRWRSAVGQVLRLSPHDVSSLQDSLNQSCGSGAYAVRGDICTDATGQALQGVLVGLRFWLGSGCVHRPARRHRSCDGAPRVSSQRPKRAIPCTSRPALGRACRSAVRRP